MSADADLLARERDTIRQYADWYSERGYQVIAEPAARELPEFLRAFAPDLIARRNGENIVVEIKTSSPQSFEKVQRLATVLENRAGWKLQVVYADLADPEWQPPGKLPSGDELRNRLTSLTTSLRADERNPAELLLLWSIIEAVARHRLVFAGLSPTERVSSSALIKLLLTEGIIEEDQYAEFRRGLAVRNAVAHGFLNQPIDSNLFERLCLAAGELLNPSPHGAVRDPPGRE